MTTQDLGMTEVEAFAGKMVGLLNSASLVLMTSIGHQTGLFDAMAGLPPSTSDQIAEAAGLNERYVREWLGAMVTGGIVEIDPEPRTYHLPPARAACLTRAAGPGNVAAYMQFVPLLAEVEEHVITAFRQGGGVGYSAYPRFHALMAEGSAQIYDATLIDTVLPLAPGLPERLAAGIDVADIGCGSGHAINLMARAYPNSRFTGFDFSAQAIASGRREAAAMGLANATFVEQDVATLDLVDAFDVVTAFDAIHDQAKPAAVLRNICTALRPGGTVLMADVAADSDVANNRQHPMGTYFYTVSTMHCMTVSLALDGEGLGSMWGEQTARRMLAEAGLQLQDVKQAPGDFFNNYYICTK